MALINKTLANLIGGISQQSPSLRLFNQCENQENMRSSIVNGLQSRPPLHYVSNAPCANGAFYSIDRDASYRYNLFISPEGLIVTDLNGVAQNVEYSAGWQDYLAASGDYDPYKTYKTQTLADYTFILNTQKTVQLSGSRYEDWQNQALVFIKQVNYATTWTLTLNGAVQTFGYGGANTTDGTTAKRYVNGVESGDASGLSTTEVASNLCGSGTAATHVEYVPVTPEKITEEVSSGDHDRYVTYYITEGLYYRKDGNYVAAPARMRYGTFYRRVDVAATVSSVFSEFEFTQVKSTLWIRRKDRGAFSIGVADTRGDTCITLVTSKVQQFDQLPTVAPDGYICRVVGTMSNNADDYYVRFLSNAGSTFGKGTWEECAEPGSYFQLNAYTMPWTLLHVSGTTWKFMPTDWEEKTTGDLNSSPMPQFVNKKLNNIFFYANRLCFLSDDLLCMSRALKHFNFWNETAITLSDSDPIFLSASTENFVKLYDFGMLDDDLILFSQHNQFKLSLGDVLSPKTAVLTAIGNNAYEPGTGVAATGSRLYFGHKAGDYYSACEFGTSAVTGSKEATRITNHVPNLILFNTKLHLCGSDSANTLCVFSDANPSVLSVYQYYISGANKLQSAWHKYTFTGFEIHGAFFRNNLLWLFMRKNGQAIVGTLDMSEHADNEQKEPALDYLYKITTATASNTVTLPFYIDPVNAIVLMPLANGTLTQVHVTATKGQVLTLDKASTVFYVGESYRRLFEFSTQYPVNKKADGTETAITSGRWQLQQLKLNYGYSGPYMVKVKPLFDDSAEGFSYEFTGVTMGMQSSILGRLPLESGELSIPLRGRNTELRVYVESSSWLPESFTSAEWQGLYTTKVKQV